MLLDVMDRGRFQCVVHLAAQTRVDVSIKDPYGDARDNVMGTVNVLECARKTGVQRIVFASSAAVYGDPPEKDLPLSEDYPLSPLSFYGLIVPAPVSQVVWTGLRHPALCQRLRRTVRSRRRRRRYQRICQTGCP